MRLCTHDPDLPRRVAAQFGSNRWAGQRAAERGFIVSEMPAKVGRTASSRKANYRQQAEALIQTG
jgi:hypothetical protein